MHTQAQWRSADGASASKVQFERAAIDVDLDVEAGGSGLPAPHDLLDAALAACTTLTLQLYIKRKAWPVNEIKVEVSHAKGERGHVMSRRISIDGTLDAEQYAALARIADACPVHKTLVGQVDIVTQTQGHKPG
jgi:putative redox protein